MAGIIKFVHVLIIFLSLFHVVKNDDGSFCFKDSDCPDEMCPSPLKEMCYFLQCKCGVDTIA
ncbi:putative Late nodulin [Medicago truncatula]|uniref:Nodule Cysteine-Rich (NCR) secreted peptide n=1 Tax=Medicago truncatula TaxID=3880 RepID=A7KHE5_MEDTR|nr:nodule-specific cysteine-rich peptide 315 [Medicago truncatula]AES98517.1 Nodule Cysteine-Rich (NCR) secreted peptide [Medicago truncatula]RHN56428.1 putative Late nodulin [Medicago truncatula]